MLSSFLLSEFLRNVPQGHRTIQAVIGPANSAVTEVIAYIVGGSTYQLHQVRKNIVVKYSKCMSMLNQPCISEQITDMSGSVFCTMQFR